MVRYHKATLPSLYPIYNRIWRNWMCEMHLCSEISSIQHLEVGVAYNGGMT